MVKENEIIEALHEQAKIIVDMELLCAYIQPTAFITLQCVTLRLAPVDPNGFPFLGAHKYGRYLHILTPAGADGAHGEIPKWEGITGRVKQLVKQETDRLEVQMRSLNAKMAANDAKMDAKMDAILELLKRSTD